MCILLQFIQKPHLKLMPNKQILMRIFIQMLFMRFDMFSFVMIVSLSIFIKSILQPHCVALEMYFYKNYLYKLMDKCTCKWSPWGRTKRDCEFISQLEQRAIARSEDKASSPGGWGGEFCISTIVILVPLPSSAAL